MPEIIAVIPARAGSKRIPGKNYKNFCGKPIITYPISVLEETKIISRIIVSTDSPEIVQLLASSSTTEIFERSNHFAGDEISTLDAIKEYINASQLKEDDLLLCTYPCTPMLNNELVEKLIDTYDPDIANFAILGVRVDSRMARLLKKDGDGVASMILADFVNVKSQELQTLYLDAGQMYLGTVKNWISATGILNSKVQILEVDPTNFVDIDSEEDWEMAEKAFMERDF